jgi:muramoyltetrapeptide carboxypeptidase LdcA involved in peptidoglycan recycling
VIHGNPKVFLGFSDTTITHCACLRAGLTTFYGPSVMAGFGENGGPFPYMGEAVRRTVFEPEGAVLAIETSEEGPPPVHVARFLRTLAVRGILGMLAAIVFGRPGGAHVAPEEHGAYDDAILGVVRDEQELAELPLVTGVDFGHTDPTWTIPIGAATRVDPGARTITFLGAGVR